MTLPAGAYLHHTIRLPGAHAGASGVHCVRPTVCTGCFQEQDTGLSSGDGAGTYLHTTYETPAGADAIMLGQKAAGHPSMVLARDTT